MSYEILFDGCGTTRVQAACIDRAVATGQSLLNHGRQNIVIQRIGGEAVALADIERRGPSAGKLAAHSF